MNVVDIGSAFKCTGVVTAPNVINFSRCCQADAKASRAKLVCIKGFYNLNLYNNKQYNFNRVNQKTYLSKKNEDY